MDEDRTCSTCGSTVFEEDVDLGRLVCANGHDQGRGPTQVADDYDVGGPGTIVRKKVDRQRQKRTKVLRGAKAYQLFLQSWQFLLWKQCHALVHQKGLPAELWTIIRDLWTLWLSRLEHRLHDATTIMEEIAEGSVKGEATASSGDDTDTDHETHMKRQKQGQSPYLYPKLIDTIALIHMAVIMLRRPIRLATMLKWMLEEEIPFVRAIRHIPQEMKDRLPGEYHLSLDTAKRLPGPDDLQKALYHRIDWFNNSFGMIVPAVNQNLLVLEFVRRLALPLEVYTTALRLNAITKYDFKYPGTVGPQETTRRQPTAFPESQIISLVVVATKLLFPFDSDKVKRYPKDVRDPTTLRINWASWLLAKANFDKATEATIDQSRLRPGSAIHVQDKDILDMTEQQLDQYLDWYQLTFIKTDDNTQNLQQQESPGIHKEILDMFPLQPVQERTKSREDDEQNRIMEEARVEERVREVQSSLKTRRVISQEEEEKRDLDILRPGARYARFARVADLHRAAEVSGDGENAIEIFHGEAASTACLSVKALLLAVNRTEEIIERWLVSRRREEVFADEDFESGQDDAQNQQDDDMAAAASVASPPTQLAVELGGLGIGLSPYIEDDDGDVDMEMVPG